MVFKKLQKISNVLQKKLNTIEVDCNRCLKVRAQISSCSACLDICPNNSIDLQMDSIELKQSCLNCGLCTSVCPTNALKWTNPPLLQLLDQVVNVSKGESDVYICCSSFSKRKNSNCIEVPCLGILPKEFWLNLGINSTNFNILYDPELCNQCSLKNGQELFMENVSILEQTLNLPIPFCIDISSNVTQNEETIDHNKRQFLMGLFEDVKETNTHVVQEVLEVEKILSPFEKYNQYYQAKNELDAIVEEVNGLKNSAIDHYLNYSMNYTDKRSFLYRTLEQRPDLQEKINVAIPKIKESCTKCGACSFLCPTDAIHMDAEKNLVLQTNKCVSCNLCVEICYEKHISLVTQTATVFNNKFRYLSN